METSRTKKGKSKTTWYIYVSKGVPFVLTYHSLLKQVSYIIRKHIHLLYMNEEVKKVFQPGPMVSFRSPRNLSSYLVRA